MIDRLPHIAITLMVVHGRYRPVDRNLVEVRATQANQLRIGIGEQTTLQQRIIGEVDAGHNVAGVKGHLLGLGKKVVGVAIEGQLADAFDRDEFFRNDFRGIEQIEVELMFVFFLHDLNAELPLRIVAVLDGFPEIAPVKIGVLTGNLLRFIPDDRMHAEERLPVKFHKTRLALRH